MSTVVKHFHHGLCTMYTEDETGKTGYTTFIQMSNRRSKDYPVTIHSPNTLAKNQYRPIFTKEQADYILHSLEYMKYPSGYSWDKLIYENKLYSLGTHVIKTKHSTDEAMKYYLDDILGHSYHWRFNRQECVRVSSFCNMRNSQLELIDELSYVYTNKTYEDLYKDIMNYIREAFCER